MKRLSYKTSGIIDFFALVISGVAAGACFWPGLWGWIFWFVFVPFFRLTQKGSRKGAFLRGWLFGAVLCAAGMYWFVAPLSEFLGISFVSALILFAAGCCAWHGLMFAVFGWACRAGSDYLSRRTGWRAETAFFWVSMPAMAVIEELFPKQFPFYFANTQYFHLPAVQILDISGPSGLVWLITGFNASLYLLAEALYERAKGGTRPLRFPLAAFAGMCALFLINECYGFMRMRQVDALVGNTLARGHSRKTSLIQGSVEVESFPGETYDARRVGVYRRLTDEAQRKTGPDIIIWPESVYGRMAQYEMRLTREGKRAFFSDSFEKTIREDIPEKVDMIMGARGEDVTAAAGRAGARFNIAYAVDPEKRLLGLIQKRRLFPFGEFIPFGKYFPALYRLVPQVDRLSPGGEPGPIEVNGAKAGVLICYEDLDSASAPVFSGKGAGLLVNITNESIFGYGMAPHQHLRFSALRAIENRKFLLRAVNTGASAVIDPCGRITDSLAVKERGFITRDIALMEWPTFYALHGNFFRYSGLLALSALFLFALVKPKA